MNVEGLSLDQMRVALAVLETGSFAGAAKRFGRAQSAVSYAITTLEGQLGLELFDRSGHRAVPTPHSVTLLREMAAIIARCDGLRSAAQELSRGTEPLLRLVIDQLYDLDVIGQVLGEFGALFSSTRVELVSESMEAVIRRVQDMSEIGILASLATVPAGIAAATTKPIRLLPVAAQGSPLAQGTHGLEAVREGYVQIVLSSRGPSSPGDFLVFGTRTWRVDEITAKLALLRRGVGWGYMPEHLVADDLARGSLVQLHLSGLPAEDHQPVFVLWKQGHSLGPAGRWLRDRLLRDDPAPG